MNFLNMAGPVVLGPHNNYLEKLKNIATGMERPLAVVASSATPPWVNECFEMDRKTNCTNPGIEIELIEYILAYIGWNIQYINTENAVELLKNGEADFLGYTDYYKEALMTHPNISFTVPVVQDEVVLVMNEINSDKRTSSLLLSICDLSMWLIFIFSAIFVFCMRIVLKTVYTKLYKSYILRGGSPLYLAQGATRFMVLCCFMSMVIFLGVYSNFLAIALSRQSPTQVAVRNLNELALKLKTGECRAVVMAYNEFHMDRPIMQVLNPNPGNSSIQNIALINILREAFLINPPLYVTGPDSMVEALKRKSCHVGLEYSQGQPLLESRYCGLKFIKDPATYSLRPFLFYYHINSTVGQQLAHFLEDGSPDDLYRRIVHRVAIRKGTKCTKEDMHGDATMGQSISLNQVTDVFIFLQIFLTTGIVLFFLEISVRAMFHKFGLQL